MSKVAFELRAEYEDFSGGTVALPGGEAFDVGAALKDGGGKIVLDPEPKPKKAAKGDEPAQYDAEELERAAKVQRTVDVLTDYPALKTTSAGGGSASTAKQED